VNKESKGYETSEARSKSETEQVLQSRINVDDFTRLLTKSSGTDAHSNAAMLNNYYSMYEIVGSKTITSEVGNTKSRKLLFGSWPGSQIPQQSLLDAAELLSARQDFVKKKDFR
jgi:hypothetical protein